MRPDHLGSALLAMAVAQSSVGFAQEVPSVTATTAVALPSGREMQFSGEWKVEPTLWGAHALLLGHGRLGVIEPGTRTAREVVARKYMETLSGWPVFGQDGRTVYKWLDQRRQLAAIDITSGSVRTLSNIVLKGGFFEEKHMAVTPVYDGPAAVEDLERRRVWYLTYKQLWSVESTGRNPKVVSETPITEGFILSWVFSRKRGKIFALANEGGWARLYSVGLDDAKPKALDVPQHGLTRIVLSPEEDRLLFERTFVDPAAVKRSRAAGVPVKVDSATGGGFEILHLGTGEIVEGAARGHDAGFTSDGGYVVYQARWELRRYEIATGKDEVIATVTSPDKPLPDSPSYYAFPVFAPDGRTFVVNVGEDECSQVIDVVDRRIFLAPGDHGWNFSWAPAGTKFAK